LQDDRHIDLAGRVADGSPIDWDTVEASPEADAGTLAKLKVLETLARLHQQTRTPPLDPLAAPAQVGGYRIRRPLGKGGLGVVFEAEQDSPRRPVALKVVRGPLGQDPETIRLFQREARTLARLRHPSITCIYESGMTPQGEPFIAMELVRGRALDAWTASRPASADAGEVRLRLTLFRQIAEAVGYAHQRGVAHRDLKPANILVVDGPSDHVPQVKVLDFGIAHVISTTLVTEAGRIRGTFAYMSPEQTLGNPDEVDVRADIYALGVVLYEMLTGSRPYDIPSGALRGKLEAIRSAPPRPFAALGRDASRVDPRLQALVFKALQKRPADRYQSVFALLEDLDRCLEPPPRATRLRGRLASMLMLGLVAYSIFVTVLYFRERRQDLGTTLRAGPSPERAP
jgi:serine/threonine protein kinase